MTSKKENGFGLGNIYPNATDLMDHLAEYSNLTDEDITKMASDQNGALDAVDFLTIHLERDLCKGAVAEILEKLLK